MKHKYRTLAAFLSMILLFGFINTPQVQAQNNSNTVADLLLPDFGIAANVKNADAVSSKTSKVQVTINKGTYQLGKLISIIASQAKLKPSYSKDFVPVNKKIQMPKLRTTVEKALDLALKGTSLDFKIVAGNQLIFVKKRNKTLQRVKETVTGTVISSLTEKPLIGVNILVKGTTLGTVTNVSGHYNISVPSLQDTLVFTYIGYEQTVVPIGGRTRINVKLISKRSELNQLVVVGIGKKETKKELIKAVSVVSNERLELSPSFNLGNTLTGKLTGVSIRQLSGLPGGWDPVIHIRGVGTFGDSDPIVVVDGVKMGSYNAFKINPHNVKSISVLKGPSATALYGIEGANGVILITTKRGQKGPTQISAGFSYGMQIPTLLPDYEGSYGYSKLYTKTQRYEQRWFNGHYDANTGKFVPGAVDPSLFKFSQEARDAFRSGKYPLIYPSTDWVHYVTKPFAGRYEGNISFSGGTDKARYYIAADFLKQGGILKTFNQSYDFNPSFKQYNVRANIDIDITPTTLLKITSNGRIGKRIRRRTTNSYSGAQFENLYRGAPWAGSGLVNGRIVTRVYADKYLGTHKMDPFWTYFGRGYRSHTRNVLDFKLKVTQKLNFITKGLSASFKGSYYSDFQENRNRIANFASYVPFFRVDVDPNLPPGSPQDSMIVYRKHGVDGPTYGSVSYGKRKNWYISARLHYMRDFGQHSISVTALGKQRRTFYPSSYPGIPLSLVGLVGQVNYKYKGRYILNINASYNGSENFEQGKRFGFFPSVSGGWIVSDESFMQNIDFLSFLKLTGSYGVVGNDQGVGRFLYLPANFPTSVGGGYNFGYQIPQDVQFAYGGDLGNPAVHWETAYKQNYSINANFFQNNLQLTYTYFREHRTNILTRLNTIPAYAQAGVAYPAVNVGVVDKHGFEAKVKWQQNVTPDFSYNIEAHVTYAKNKISYIDEVFRKYPYERRTGKMVGQPFGKVFAGFITKDDLKPNSGLPKYNYDLIPGLLKFKDLNGDGVIDSDDERAVKYPGVPLYTFGATIGFHYRNFVLTTVWNAAAFVSRELAYSPYRVGFGVGGQAWWGLLKWIGDESWKAWQTPEQNAKAGFPRLYTKIGQRRNSLTTGYWWKPARYVRLKNVMLSYTFAPNALQTIGVKQLSIYAQGYNLFTWSPILKYDIDPEQSGWSSSLRYPINKVINFGINVKF